MEESEKTSTPLFDALEIQRRFKELNPHIRTETLARARKKQDQRNENRRKWGIRNKEYFNAYRVSWGSKIKDEAGYHHKISNFLPAWRMTQALKDAPVVEIDV